MKKLSTYITKAKYVIIIIALLLLIPAFFGYKNTSINYDILSFLPEDIETVQGQEILKNEFEIGSYTVILVDKDLPNKEINDFEDKIRGIDSVGEVVSLYDVLGNAIPADFLPSEIQDKIDKNGYTPILVTFTSSISDEETFSAIQEIREIANESAKITGTTALELDTKELADKEVKFYVLCAVGLCLLILELTLDSFIVPFILLIGIGLSIVYNMGSNIMLGEISYITKAIAAVLQLGVTMDFSIFLYHSYQRNKAEVLKKAKKSDNRSKLNDEAMASAINETFVSIVGSSTTTIAGFLALCAMELTLGKDIGIVMAKGVLIGLIAVVTILPAMILVLDKLIEKTKTKELLPAFKHINNFIIKHHIGVVIVALIVLIPAIYGNSHVNIYYNIDKSLPDDLDSVVANKQLQEDYEMASTQIALVDKDLSIYQTKEMTEKIEALDGVEWVVGAESVESSNVPIDVLPDEIKSKLESDNYKILIINSTYKIATDEENALVDEINEIIKSYDENSILAGEGPLTKDLVEIADHDFTSVNVLSIIVVLIIMILTLKSVSLPIIVVAVIEFAIMFNMSISFYMNKTLPFVASIVIGTIQLGATVDYAILVTTKYIGNRKSGKNKYQAVADSLNESIKSIVTSALCFFGATFGVAVISEIDMIKSICVLISRGALISMFSVILILPAMLLIFDKLICKTTMGMRKLDN